MMNNKTVPLKVIHKTEGGTNVVETKQFSAGRIVRTAAGGLVIVADVLAFATSHIFLPIVTKEAASWGVGEIGGHIAFLAVGVLMFDKETGLALVDHVTAKFKKS